MRHSLMHPVRFVAQFGLALAVLGFTSTPALALLIPTVETVVTSNDGTTAVVDLFFTTPDEGIKSFSVSVAYDGSLSVVDATCEVSNSAATIRAIPPPSGALSLASRFLRGESAEIPCISELSHSQ